MATPQGHSIDQLKPPSVPGLQPPFASTHAPAIDLAALAEQQRDALYLACHDIASHGMASPPVYLATNDGVVNPFGNTAGLMNAILAHPMDYAHLETLYIQNHLQTQSEIPDVRANKHHEDQLSRKLIQLGCEPLLLDKAHSTLWIGVNTNTIQGGTIRSAEEVISIPEILRSLALLHQIENINIMLMTPTEFGEWGVRAKKRDRVLKELAIVDPSVAPTQAFDTIIEQALKLGASDIHIRPEQARQIKSKANASAQGAQRSQDEDAAVRVVVSFRVDGVLVPTYELTGAQSRAVTSIIKQRANLDIAEGRRRQDGSISLSGSRFEGVNLRVATMLVEIGAGLSREAVVLRILNSRHEAIIPLEEMGYEPDQVQAIRIATQEPQGIILVTGPTGSGKTTLLYSVLRTLQSPGVNIVTIEDPVEQIVPGLLQVRVNEAIDNSFEAVLRGTLRLDPDILLVGEIRDSEVLKVASQAANTGHLVLTTLHANGVFDTPSRLEDLGLEGAQFQNIAAIVAQRLVRKICDQCAERYDARNDLNRLIGQDLISIPVPLRRPSNDGQGLPSCSCCAGVGYKGRRAIGEVLPLNGVLHELLSRRDFDLDTFKRAAFKQGFRPMLFTGLCSVMRGETTLEELRGTVGTAAFQEYGKSVAEHVTAYFGVPEVPNIDA